MNLFLSTQVFYCLLIPVPCLWPWQPGSAHSRQRGALCLCPLPNLASLLHPKHLSGLVSGMLWALAGLFVSSVHLSLKFAKSSKTIFADIDICNFRHFVVNNVDFWPVPVHQGLTWLTETLPRETPCCCPAQRDLFLRYAFQCRGFPQSSKFRWTISPNYLFSVGIADLQLQPISLFSGGELLAAPVPGLCQSRLPISLWWEGNKRGGEPCAWGQRGGDHPVRMGWWGGLEMWSLMDRLGMGTQGLVAQTQHWESVTHLPQSNCSCEIPH